MVDWIPIEVNQFTVWHQPLNLQFKYGLIQAYIFIFCLTWRWLFSSAMYYFIKTLAFYLNRGNSKLPDYTVAGWCAQWKFAPPPSLCTVAPRMQQTAPRRAITAMAVSSSDAVWPISVAYESYLYLNKISLRYPEYSAGSLEYSGLQVVKSNKMFAALCFK